MNKDYKNNSLHNTAVEKSENFKIMFEAFNVPMNIISLSGIFLKVNKAFCELLGYEEIELLNMNFLEFTHPDDRESNSESLKNLVSGELKSLEFEKRYIKKNGEVVVAKVSSVLLRDILGNAEFIAVAAENITKIKKSENELIESERLYRQFFDEDLTLILKSTSDGRILMCNEAFVKIVGCDSVEQVLKMNAHDFYMGQTDRNEFLNKLKEKGKLELYEITMRGCDGRTIHAIENVIGKYDENGELVEISGYLFDITDRKKVELELIESEKKYRQLIENASEIILLTDKDGNFTFANEAALKFSGYTFEEITSFNYLDLVHEDYKKKVRTFYYRQLIKKDETSSLQFPFYTKDGGFKWLEQNVKLLTEDYNIIGFQLIARDVTERVEVEHELKESENKFRNIFENSPVGKSLTTVDGKFNVNQAFCEILGYTKEELSNVNWEKVTYADDILKSREEVNSLLNGEKEKSHFEKRYIHKNGSVVWTDVISSIQKNKEGKPLFFITNVLDITEKNKMDEELFTSRQMMRLILDNVPQRIFWKDKNFKYLGCNKPFAKDACLKDPSEIIGMDDFEMTWKDTAKLYRADDKIVMDSNTPKLNIEEQQTHFSGEVTWLRTNKVPLHDKDGNVIGVIGTYEDITLSKQSEEQILLLSRAVEKSPASVMITDMEGNIEYVNRKFIDLTGYSLEEVKGKNPRILKSGEKSEEDYKILWETIKSGKEWRGEFHNKKKNGELYWESATIVPIKNGRTFFLAVKEDITERKKAELLLKESEERFEQVTTSSDEWVWEVNTNGLYTYSSIAVEKILGYSPEEIVGKKYFYDLFVHEMQEEIKEAAFSMMDKKETIRNLVNPNLHKDGTKIYLETNGFPILDSNGSLIGYRGADKDITERRQIQKELILAKEKAEESDKLKSEFLAQMSHEIRTPINIITSNVNFISEELADKIDAEDKDCFEGIDLASKRIIRTVDLILNVAELQTSGYNPYKVKVDLNSEILNKLYKEHQLLAKQKELELIYICESKDTKILADVYSVTQIFANLIDNAIKYTKKGKVEILLGKNKTDNTMVEVKDTGIGMSKEFLSRMFEPFVQEEHGFTRSYDGNGLGLTLVKNYCEINNAVIKVESEKGIGTTFTITFSN